jgi:O-acetyl-ADP-ribose deacetylase (regulator of RNase III)
MTVEVRIGDITKIQCDAVVNPANSYGYMGGGVAGALKRIGGSKIEHDAVKKAPIPLGSAVATTGGQLPCQYVIHAPTMERPAMRIGVENVHNATYAALRLAKELGLNSIAIPGMGTGVGGVPEKDAAKTMVAVVQEFEKDFERIILIDRNESMIKSFMEYLNRK